MPQAIAGTWLSNYQPLPIGEWEGKKWTEIQKSRSSNDSNIQGSGQPDDYLQFFLISESKFENVDEILFDVVVDLPGVDQTCWKDLTNGSLASFNNLVVDLALTLDQANQRGFYIANPQNAHAAFRVEAISYVPIDKIIHREKHRLTHPAAKHLVEAAR